MKFICNAALASVYCVVSWYICICKRNRLIPTLYTYIFEGTIIPK